VRETDIERERWRERESASHHKFYLGRVAFKDEEEEEESETQKS
jgi:hypothetical protein